MAQRRNEPGFEPLALLMKELAGVVDVHIFEDLRTGRRSIIQAATKQTTRTPAPISNPICGIPASSLGWRVFLLL